MEGKLLNFLLEVEKLKKIQRTGWVWREVKNPETIAQHTFRVTLLNWLLGERVKPKLDLEKLIKISLAHDLCEVYVGDITPYWGIIPSDPKKRREILKRWIRLTKEKKEKRLKIKLEREKKALKRLVKTLPPLQQKEIMTSWLAYESSIFGNSKEGKFVKQGDKIETLLQAIEYFGTKPDSLAAAWWEEVEDLVDHPVLLDFLIEIEKKFYTKKKADPLLDFLVKVGKLKALARRGWVIRGIKQPETIADHSFMVALMVWVFGQERKINLKRALKMALIHEICAIYAGDYTPHDIFGRRFGATRFNLSVRYDILGPRLRWRRFWQQRPRLPKETKAKRFQRVYQKETKALQALIKKLPPYLKQEILGLWKEFNEKKTKESDFVDQVNCLATFLQACQYWKKNSKFPIKVFGEQVAEFISDPQLVEFLKIVKRKFKLQIKEASQNAL